MASKASPSKGGIKGLRLNKRETFGEEMTKKMKKMRDAFESAMEDEENAIALKLTRDMTPIHVVEKILSNDLVNK
jgi:uncharacterized protein YgfB (UPF0149 family)